jgi:HAE1 family hydrophobic/amphiphilic exporter-1
MVVLMVFLAGWVAYQNLELAYMPSTDVPMCVISTSYAGAGPEEIEDLVTKKVEEQMSTITGVDTITSNSSSGSSRVMIQFVDGTDLDDVMNDVRDKVERVKNMLPDGADDPSIMKMDMNQESIRVGVTSSKYDMSNLYDLLDNYISDRFEKVDGVSSVSMRGGIETEIQVTLDPAKLEAYGISMTSVRQKLSSENTNASAGSLYQGNTELTLRAVGEFESLQDIKDLYIATSGSTNILLKDIATVEEVEKDQDRLSLINGEEGIMFELSKASDANIVTVTDNINAEIENIKEDYPDLNITMLSNTAEYIQTSIENVTVTAFESALIAVIVLLFFLRDWRTSLVIGVSIPTSIFATFACMYLKGMTMNTISMGGIVIGIGMLVDNSVVVLENIYKHWQNGETPKRAAARGTNEVAMAVTASTLTTVAVFGPMAFMNGTIGQILQDLALTIVFALLASLVVSLTFCPMMCSLLLKDTNKKNKKGVKSRNPLKRFFGAIGDFIGKLLDGLDRAYGKLLALALRFRIITCIIVIAVFCASLVVKNYVGTDLMSSSDESALSVSASLPDGSDFETSEEIFNQILNAIGEIPEQKMSNAMVSEGSVSINYELVDKEERDRSTDDICTEVRQKLKNIAGANITVSASSNAMGSMGGGGGFTLNLYGEDTETLRTIANDLVAKIETIDGFRDVESSLDESIPEGNIRLNRAKAARYGISTSDISSLISSANTGVVATQFKDDGNEIDIRVKYPDDQLNYIKDLNNITITANNGTIIPLTAIADIEMGESAVTITRENQQRYISVTGNADGLDSSTIQNLVQEKVNEYVFPDNYTYDFGGTMKTMNNAFSSLFTVIIVAILLVYMIMASQFESIVYPFMIMFSMPIAITGGILGLFICGQSITTTAYMGFIMLVGMVVNNAIVLVDYANQLRDKDKNLSANDALKLAGPSRLRPILMTTLTTIIGLLPMAIANKSGMETQQPMGIAVIFGLMLSTLVTLVFIPVLYSLINSVRGKIRHLYEKISHDDLDYEDEGDTVED